MAFSVNTNSNAMAALRSLSSTQNNISNIQSQIQSGLKIGGATDDPSTFVMMDYLKNELQRCYILYGKCVNNIQH